MSRVEHGSRVLRQLRPFLIGTAALPIVAALYWGQGLFIPIALAGLFTFVLGPLVGALERAGLGRMPAGRPIAVILVVGLAFSALGGTGWVIAQQVMTLASDLPQYRGNIMRKIGDIRGRGEGLAEVQSTAKEVMGEAPEGRVPEALGAAGLVLVLSIFMLIERHEIRNRFIRLLGHGRLAKVTKALDEAGNRITRYLIMQTLINVMYGSAIGIGLFFIGVPYAVLWGFLAFVLRFIPYVGTLAAAVGPIILSLAVFSGWRPRFSSAGGVKRILA